MERGVDTHHRIRARAVRAPDELAGLQVERAELSLHAHLPAGVADVDEVLHDERCHRGRRAILDVGGLRAPHLLACRGVDSDGVIVERIVDQLPVGQRPSANDDVAARLPHRDRRRIRIVLPFDRRAGLREVERVRGVGVRSDDVHRVPRDQRRPLVPMRLSVGETPRDAQLRCIARVDLVERTVARVRVVARRHRPFAIAAHAPLRIARGVGASHVHGRRRCTARHRTICGFCGGGSTARLAIAASRRQCRDHDRSAALAPLLLPRCSHQRPASLLRETSPASSAARVEPRIQNAKMRHNI